MKKTGIFLTILFISFLGHQYSTAQRVNIGEKCPDITLTTLINYPSKDAKLLSTFNDKPLIIDFWFTACPPCINFIPYLDSLQKAYNNQFNILLATFEDEENVRKFIQKNDELRNIKTPIATSAGSKLPLMKMFPHTVEPHEIWISKTGIVQAITSHDEVTPERIEKFINGGPLEMAEKKEIIDRRVAMGQQPMLITDQQYNSGEGKLFYSYLGKINTQLPGLLWNGTEKGATRILCQNCGVKQLYEVAFRKKDSQIPVKIVPKCADTSRFNSSFKEEKNVYSYEVYIKDTSYTLAHTIMLRDLNNFFHLKSRIILEPMLVYVLSKLNTHEKFKSDENIASTREKINNQIIIKGTGIDYVTGNRLYSNLKYRVINETGYRGKVNLVLPETSDINALKKSLNEYGLDINLKKRNNETVILEDE